MAELDLGTQGMTDEDRRYAGSRFSEVVAALFANPYQRVWGAPGEPPFPVHEVTFEAATQGILPGGPPHAFHEASARTIDSGADLRWGVNRKGFRRIVHPNGLCLIGTWHITADTPYSGYFATGSRGLAVARYDSRDGYGAHPRETSYVAADAASPKAACSTVATPQPAPSKPANPAPAPVPPAAAWPLAGDQHPCPQAKPIKGNQSSMIAHSPGQQSYLVTNPEACFANLTDAAADGYRPAKR